MPHKDVFNLNLVYSNDFISNSNLKFPAVGLSVLLDIVKQSLLKYFKDIFQPASN